MRRANGTASVNGGPAEETRSQPQTLTQHFSSRLHQLDQRLERKLIEAVGGLHPSHVIDGVSAAAAAPAYRHISGRSIASKCRSTCQPSGAIIWITRSNTRLSGTPPRCRTKLNRQPLKAALVQLAQFALGDRVVDIGDRAIGAAACSDRVQRDAVVGAVHAGVDDHGAADAELGMQRAKIRQRRVRRRIRPVWRIRIFRVAARRCGNARRRRAAAA